jgi:hypothetical protein
MPCSEHGLVVLDMQPVQGLAFLHRIGSHFDNRALCKDVVRFAIAFGVGVVAAPLLSSWVC